MQIIETMSSAIEVVETCGADEFEVDGVHVWHGGTSGGRVSVMIYTGKETIEVMVMPGSRRAVLISRDTNRNDL